MKGKVIATIVRGRRSVAKVKYQEPGIGKYIPNKLWYGWQLKIKSALENRQNAIVIIIGGSDLDQNLGYNDG